ncbi:MAG: DUF1080 domain-containing protein [Bryobacteraceae bacterium]|nr:DUF1080 domain-containing protein [Bryobacteraceae bacterium]
MRLALAALAAASLLCAQSPVLPERTLRLFNGKNLDGWYTYLRESKYDDPKRVFTLQGGLLRISGEEWGGIATKESFRDYHLIVEWKWGGATWGDRKTRARDSGVLVHGAGADGAHSGCWLESYEAQIIEGGNGDIILVAPRGVLSLTAEARKEPNGQVYYQPGAPAITMTSGRLNWYGRDPKWTDTIDFRGTGDLEKPLGKWNRLEVICDGDSITNVFNGKVVASARGLTRSEGKIQIQSEGAEILIRKVELRPLKKRS